MKVVRPAISSVFTVVLFSDRWNIFSSIVFDLSSFGGCPPLGNNQPFYNTCLFYHGIQEKNIGILPNNSHFSCTLFTESLQLPRQAWNQPGSGATGREGRKRKNQIPKWVPGFWQRMRDSNPRKRSQSPVCYRYTNPLYVTRGHMVETTGLEPVTSCV